MLNRFIHRSTGRSGITCPFCARTGQRLVDCMLNQLDMAYLLQENAADQVTVLSCVPSEIIALEKNCINVRISPNRPPNVSSHFACWIGFIRNDQIDQIEE